MDRPKPLSPAEAYEAIQRLLSEGDVIAWSMHARQRARERGVTTDDVRRVLVMGTVSPSPEWNERFENWNYVVRGRDLDGIPLAVVIALVPAQCRITVVTVKDVSQ
jgi:hypothetical protein